jgi:ferritin-like metal-binding protein YciE
MSLESLRDLYVEELKDIYNAEKQLLKALPRMAKRADSPELQQAFREHADVTQKHVERLDQIFESLGKKASGKKCKGMEGLIEEGKSMLEEDGEPAVIDAGLIAAAQRVEHYEIAVYGTLKTYARILGDEDAAGLLEETLGEEKETDEKLNQIAESLNLEAEEAGEEDSDEEEEEDAGDGSERSRGEKEQVGSSSRRGGSSRRR